MSARDGCAREAVYWCKYCNQKIVNNAKCRKHHEESVTHQVNMKKYEAARIKERRMNDKEQARIDKELEKIQYLAQDQYIKNDLMKEQDHGLLMEHLQAEEENEIARKLYGDAAYQKMTEKSPEIDKTKAYNDFMKSLPGKVPKKYRQQIDKFTQ